MSKCGRIFLNKNDVIFGRIFLNRVALFVRVNGSSVCKCLQFVCREYTPLGVGGECLYIKKGGKVGGGVSRLVAK